MEGDFSFMKSGFNNLQSQEENEKIQQNIVGTIVHFTENALKTAGFYTKHSGRNIITKEDIKRCFMLEVFFFYNRQNLVENIEKVIKELYSDSSSGEEEGEEKEEDSDDDIEENEIYLKKILKQHLN